MRSTLFILWLLSAIPVYAQSDSLHIYSMQGVYQQNNWLTGANPVGMSFNRFRSFSVAEVGYRFEDGNFGNVSLPASSNKSAVFFLQAATQDTTQSAYFLPRGALHFRWRCSVLSCSICQ